MTCVTISKFEVDHKVSIWDLTVPEAWPYNQPFMDKVITKHCPYFPVYVLTLVVYQ